MVTRWARDAPAVAEYLPAGHGAHEEAAIAPTTADPAGHVWHAESPSSAVYVPVAQSVHVEDPAAPAGHGVHINEFIYKS
jgi:hypothetical protein